EVEVAIDDHVRCVKLLGPPATRCTIDRAKLGHRLAALLDRLDQEAIHSRAYDLRQRSTRAGNDRRPARERFGEDDGEWFCPLDWRDHGARVAEARVFLGVVHRADILDAVVADLGLDLLLPVLALRTTIGVIAGNDQALAGTTSDLDRPVRALDALD